MPFPDEDEDDSLNFDSHSDEESEDFEESGLEEESRETDAGIDTPPETYSAPTSNAAQAPQRRRMVEIPQGSNGARPRVSRKPPRVRPMPQALRVKWPDVCTMLITNTDGSQIFFVKGI